MPIPATIPTLVGLGVAGATQSQSEPFDVLLGGFKFMLDAGPENPLVRRGAQYRSDQINFSGDPGEQALGFWWQRSQDTWHYGTGAPTFDGVGAGDPQFASGRFADSYGVDPWTAGELKLLRDTDRIAETTADVNPSIVTRTVTNQERLYWADGDAIMEWDGGTVTSITDDWSNIFGMCSDGSTLYVVTDAGKVHSYTAAGVEAELYTGISGSLAGLFFVKQRLILSVDNALYELDTSASSAALPTALYTHPSPSWLWSDVEQGPGAIYASGYAGTNSAVFKFVLDGEGALPTLTAGITAVELPAGERALWLRAYLGFIAISTSEGLRVCQFQDTDIILAPLTIEGVGAVGAVAGWDRFLYCAIDDAGENVAGLARVDLSGEIAAGKFAWAKDARANSDPFGFSGDTGNAFAVCMFQGRPAFIVQDTGVYTVSADRYVRSGSLTSGRILFGMADFKVFQRASLTTGGQGTVALSTGTDSDTANVPRTSIDTTVRDRIEVDIGSTRGSTLTVGILLTRASTSQSPRLLSFSVKALPSQPREEQWIVPLRLYDRTENRFGEPQFQRSIDVLNDISDLVRFQRPTVFQTFFGEPDSWQTWIVQVEDFEFRQSTSEGSWGGGLTVSLRSLRGE